MGDVYPEFAKLPKGEFELHLCLRHDNVPYLQNMKDLQLYIERKLEDKEVIGLSFFSQPDGPVTGNGNFEYSTLVPGKKASFYVAPPTKDKLSKNFPEGSVLVGAISYGKVSLVGEKNPASYMLSFIVPPFKSDGHEGKAFTKKSVFERLDEKVRHCKITFLRSLKLSTEEERSEWKQLTASLKSEYPKYIPLLSRILDVLVARKYAEDKICYYEEVVNAADEVIDSIDREELPKYFWQKSPPEDADERILQFEMETIRDQLAEALYQKGLALAEIESLKGEKVIDNKKSEVAEVQLDLFEENFKELRKWADVNSSPYALISVFRERRRGMTGTALQILRRLIADAGGSELRKLHKLQVSLWEG